MQRAACCCATCSSTTPSARTSRATSCSASRRATGSPTTSSTASTAAAARRPARAFDRDDGYQLATALDDIVDLAEEAADQLGLYRVEAPMEQAAALADVLVGAGEQVARALRRCAPAPTSRRDLVEIHRLENEGDRSAATRSPRCSRRASTRWSSSAGRTSSTSLEAAVDACEKVAHMLEGIGAASAVGVQGARRAGVAGFNAPALRGTTCAHQQERSRWPPPPDPQTLQDEADAVARIPQDIPVTMLIRHGRAGKEIVAQTEEEDDDVVLLGPRGVVLLGAMVDPVSDHVPHHTGTSVFVAHAPRRGR